jgi:hypothetical protein
LNEFIPKAWGCQPNLSINNSIFHRLQLSLEAERGRLVAVAPPRFLDSHRFPSLDRGRTVPGTFPSSNILRGVWGQTAPHRGNCRRARPILLGATRTAVPYWRRVSCHRDMKNMAKLSPPPNRTFRQDGLTVAHINNRMAELHLQKGMTTSHLAQALGGGSSSQGQTSTPQPAAAPTTHTTTTSQKD